MPYLGLPQQQVLQRYTYKSDTDDDGEVVRESQEV